MTSAAPGGLRRRGSADSLVRRVVGNFLRYVSRHEACPEYKDDTDKARALCARADVEMSDSIKLASDLPGPFNVACQKLFCRPEGDEDMADLSQSLMNFQLEGDFDFDFVFKSVAIAQKDVFGPTLAAGLSCFRSFVVLPTGASASPSASTSPRRQASSYVLEPRPAVSAVWVAGTDVPVYGPLSSGSSEHSNLSWFHGETPGHQFTSHHRGAVTAQGC